MGARREVVDDVGARAGDRRARRRRVEQVDALADARDAGHVVAGGGAGRGEVAPGEPGGAGDQDAQLSAARSRPGAPPSRGRWRRRPPRSTGSRSAAGGFSRRSSSPSTTPNSRWRQVACANARGRRTQLGERRRRGRARSPASVARCSASPASGPRSGAGSGRRGATFAYSGAEQRAVADVQRERRPAGCAEPPRATSRAEQLGVVVVDAEDAACRAAAARPTRPRRRRPASAPRRVVCGRWPSARNCNGRHAGRVRALQ